MASFQTPNYSHLTQQDYENVYEPAEDTFLLMDALEQDIDNIHQLKPSVCVEIGCGSGLVITFLAKILNNSAMYIATDRNAIAAECAKRTASQNQVVVEVVTSDLLQALQPQLNGGIDLLLFNPPYVVTPSEE
ncbi:methyltransferase N6AMT1-like, partial [Amphiura filiformis]|uniref:methyltransferase N6AMT1-like n=1 Tax=Amphiura filiformis TaxID=82378 RepID=UPI003B2261A9